MGSCVSRQDVVHQQTGRAITDVQKSIELDTPLQKGSSGARIDKNSPDIRDQINAEIRALREQLVHSQVLFTYLLKNSSSESTKSPDGKKELCTLLEGGALGEAMFQCKSFDGQALARLYNRSNRSSSSYTSHRSTPMHCGYTSLSCPILPIDYPALTKSTQTDEPDSFCPRHRTNSFLSAVQEGSREEFPRKLSILLEEDYEESAAVSCSQPFLNRKKRCLSCNAKTQTDAINSNKNLPVTETCYPRCGFSIVSQAVQKRTVFSVELPKKLVVRYPPPYTSKKCRPQRHLTTATRHLSLEKQESFSSSCGDMSSDNCGGWKSPPTYQQSILAASFQRKNSQIDALERNTERAASVTPPKGIPERATSDGDVKLMDEKKGFKQRSLRRGSGAGSPNSLLTIPRCPAFDFSEQEDVFPPSTSQKKRDTKSLMPELMENSETESTKGSFECESLEMLSEAPDIAFPSLPNTFLAKLGVHKDSPLPVEAFDEQDLESKFVALSLAFKTDRSTLNKRLELHKRQRDMAEKNVENEFQSMRDQLSALNLKATNSDIRDLISKIQNHLDIAQQATSRVSGRSETYGAVQQEERVSQAFEVLVLHVDHLKRLFDKEHKELEETKRMLTDTRVFKKDFTTADIIITEDKKKYSKTFGLPVSSIKSVGRRRASVADPFLDPEFSQKVEACSSSVGLISTPTPLARTSPVDPFQLFSSKKDVWTRKLSSVTDEKEHLEEEPKLQNGNISEDQVWFGVRLTT